ncbi:MAG: fused MFS/spermidine synthase [Dehalococcoidales bacterium]|nr:MAG: fused MFS/spermidine synthase [Dehalococcoidales bacterium]
MVRKIPPHLLAVLILGAVCQIGQVVLLRELLMVFHGNELTIGIILAAWLAWVGVGSRFGAVLIERVNRPVFLLILNVVGVLPTLTVTILLIRGLRGFFDIIPGAYLSLPDMTISCFILMAPVCVLLGAQFVLLSRVWRESDRIVDTSSAGKTYLVEAIGSVVGGVLFTLIMVHYLNALQSAILACMLMLATTLLIIQKLEIGVKHLSLRSRLILLSPLVLAAIAFPFLEQVDDWAYRIQWQYFMPQYQLIETHQSKHGTIFVVQREDQYSFFQSGHLVFTTAGPEAITPGLEEQEASAFAHLSMVQHESPKRLLLIGGGLRGTLGEIVKHPIQRIDYIELDRVLTEAAQPYVSPVTLAALTDPRVHLIHTDGRLFVKSTQERYDMIIVDVPDPATAVLNRYYTEEFFREVETSLNPDGVFIIGVVSTADLRGTPIANRNTTIYHTLRSVFSRVLPAGEQFMFYFATNEPEQISVDVPTLQQRYLERNIETDGFSYHHYHTLLQESQLNRVNWVVRNHGYSPSAHLEGPEVVPLFPGTIAEQENAEKQLPTVERHYFINSDFKPIGYYYTIMFWDERARTGHPETFKWLLHVKSWWVLPLVGLSLLIVVVLRLVAGRFRKRSDINFAVLFAVFTTGLSTMALQIALLFSFQSIYGFVYEMVGLIVAIFMGGLALGTSITQRFVTDKANPNILAGVQLLIALLAGLIAIILPGAAVVQSPAIVFMLFSSLTFIAGLINGVDFPLSVACCMALNRRAEKSVGTVYSVELLGACVGAGVASVVVAPILGIGACCLFAAIANGTAFIVLLVSRRFYG